MLPLHEHLVSFLDERSLCLSLLCGSLFLHAFLDVLLLELSDFLTIVLVEGYVVVADEVVALLARSLWSLAVAPLEPSEHGLADVDATVVDDVGLDHLVAVGFHDLGQRPTEEVVAHVTEVERLVGVRRRVLDHHEWTVLSNRLLTEFLVSMDGIEESYPSGRCDRKVEETLYHIEVSDDIAAILLQVLADFLCSILRFLFRHLEEWEHDEGKVTFEITLGLLQGNHLLWYVLTIKLLHRCDDRADDFVFYLHYYYISLFTGKYLSLLLLVGWANG